eukprot:CAMPEP_0194282394 /NCGR_PEP_ID=MMETSP0169-20130528/22991_1 /TAXON_ID=218684 /ORGANISM="Corethron pennatum, Strain L29A3" /LENGTH=855 /DNA_ID=CAMNT_0039027689 /DNA_START=79 /DNA_END=2646 /DNA_ORIENTATION=-
MNYNLKIFLFTASTIFASVESQDQSQDQLCTPNCVSGRCSFTVQVDLHAGELGYYTFEECPELGPNPTLAIKRNVNYEFIQTHNSNWMHPLGFAYEADGAHVDELELEAGVLPPGSGVNCDENLSCPAPKYLREGILMDGLIDGYAVGSEDSVNGFDFGLEAYEHMFFYPINQWAGYGPFSVTLNFNNDDFGLDIFYFCHIHIGMSGRIKFVGDDGTAQVKKNLPLLPYEYDQQSDFDKECGTYGLEEFQLPNSQCLSEFVCDVPRELEQYSKCYDAMNCAMMIGMTTNALDEKALFLHQMIPHHQNAVNMAKALLITQKTFCADITIASSEDLSGGATAGGESEDSVIGNSGKDQDYCLLDAILRSVIGEQNHQIQTMQGILERGSYPDENDCIVTVADLSAEQKKRNLEKVVEEETQGTQEKRQLDEDYVCMATCVSESQCSFTARINYFAGELGYYEFDECPHLGTNPTLGIKKNVSYVFLQADSSNWMHPLGFAYEADGAHTGVDELEPGIAPPGSGSTCGEDFSCPAPMYSVNGIYVGDYSNNPAIEKKSVGLEDFGLDTIEAMYYRPIGDWTGYGEFSVSVLFDVENFDRDIFYFCHIHSGMSGRIKFLDSTEHLIQEENNPAMPYIYDNPSTFDENCGTYGLNQYQLPHRECPSMFVCQKSNMHEELKQYSECYDAMNCAMAVGMTTKVEDEISLFIHQMIPHHQNAVNMAKTLLHSGKISCYDLTLETNDCLLHVLLVSIINSQNHQIQVMRGVLDSKNLKEDYDCNVAVSGDFTSQDEKFAAAESEDYKPKKEEETPVEVEDTKVMSDNIRPMSSEDEESFGDSSGSKTTASLLISLVLCSILLVL